jgi:hypothetical protein
VTPAALAGVGAAIAIWLGGVNLLARRLIERRKGPLGAPNATWVWHGMFFAPDWASYVLVAAGALLVLVAAVWAALT